MFSINPIIGNTITPEPIAEMTSNSPRVPSPFPLGSVNIGILNSGKPAGIAPEMYLQLYSNVFIRISE